MPYSLESLVESELNGGHVREEILKLYPEADIFTARDYQAVACDAILNAYEKDYVGFLLADEVGLGKTISASLVAKHDDFQRILVVTTLAAVAHWRNTLLKFHLPGKEIVVINYDRLQKLFKLDDSKYKSKAKTKKAKNKPYCNRKIYLTSCFLRV